MTNTESPRPSLTERLVQIGRLCAIAIVVVVCLSTARSMWRLFHPTKQIVKQEEPPPSAAEIVAALPAKGYWTFSEFNWRLSQRAAAGVDLDKYLREAAERPLADDTPTNEETLVLQWLTTQSVKPLPLTEDTNIWKLTGSMPIHAVVRERMDQRRLVVAVLELPDRDGNQLWEISPQNAKAEATSTKHLLPLPADSRRVMARWSQDGQLMLESINTPDPIERLLPLWKSHGWKTKNFLEVGGVGATYLCEQNNERILVYDLPPTATSAAQLMFVRNPEPASQP